MMSDDEIIAVVQAHKEGKQIERHYFEWSDDHWVKDDFPSWDFCKCRYRVSHLLKGYCFAKDIRREPTIGMVKVEQVPLAAGENPLVRKPREWAVFEDISGKLHFLARLTGPKGASFMVREVIE